jgi:hypothetical protein
MLRSPCTHGVGASAVSGQPTRDPPRREHVRQAHRCGPCVCLLAARILWLWIKHTGHKRVFIADKRFAVGQRGGTRGIRIVVRPRLHRSDITTGTTGSMARSRAGLFVLVLAYTLSAVSAVPTVAVMTSYTTSDCNPANMLPYNITIPLNQVRLVHIRGHGHGQSPCRAGVRAHPLTPCNVRVCTSA